MLEINDRSEKVIDPSGGSNQTRVRAYNERLLLSLVRRHGSQPKSEIARRTGLSAQTVSVIMRALEKDGLLLRGDPKRGQVGQPSIPMFLNPEGAFSIGLKIGRRSADLLMVDFLGNPRQSLHFNYSYPVQEEIFQFAQSGIKELTSKLTEDQRSRIAGIGVALPFELWNWAEKIGAPPELMQDWQNKDFAERLERRCLYPVFEQNDATAACGAELIFGQGSELADFVYFFIGTFIGGGIVLNQAVYSGHTGNAGALGSMPVVNEKGVATQLIDHASMLELENQIKKDGLDIPFEILKEEDWGVLGKSLEHWINETAHHLAIAVASSHSVIDFEAAIIDGDFPSDVRLRIVEATINRIAELDLQGISCPKVYSGLVGRNARAVGAASLPLFSRYLLDQSVLFKSLSAG
ncbi:ROK family transcriptional regulator [Cocleimonas flava]|uniref:ROK family transcriptional regulator n=1 Tax=Cocleimonas flava TaxID=634765 RepID=UPI001A9D3AC3|nr:ROK family transcriptional regulator [Cocleimonas flava]